MSDRRSLGLVAGAAVVCAALAIVLPWDGARLAVALPLAFLLPGYAIVTGFGPRPLHLPVAIMLWLGCSLCVLCLGALLLNYTPGGIQTAPWAVLLTVVTLVGVVAALYRHEPDTKDVPIQGPRRPAARPIDLAVGALAVALAVAAVVLANTPLKADGAAGFTSLSIARSQGGDGVRLGVVSAEPGPRSYLLMVQVGNHAKQVVSRFGLGPADEHFSSVGPISTQGPVLVRGFLYRQSQLVVPLRRVRLWLRAEEG